MAESNTRTVQIPECMNPFVVMVNGREYSYPAGTTQEVPNEVADVIERHEESHPKPEEGGGGSDGSGGGDMLVTIHVPESYEDPYAPDKSLDEVMSAFASGKNVRFVLLDVEGGRTFLTPVFADDDELYLYCDWEYATYRWSPYGFGTDGGVE